ncbi:tyrosine-type recombinase/integrase [Thermomonospora cellulosilytica]|uniref:Integrase n=1 Tax=Thermomonospora cellulosilytica TaxID=1411118 RepID=A0A7W3R7B8_9ACTN|nr:integrase [Thermomonospora cellulosilytica]
MQSAGTFATRKEADTAWQRAEAKIAEGRSGDPRRGRQTFETYVKERWLPHHVLEASTRQDYTYEIDKHLLGFFGRMKMAEILPEHVREWVSHMQASGASPATIQKCKRAILSAIFTTALNDQVITAHPCQGVKIPPVPKRPKKVITADQFDLLYKALPNDDARLLVETDIESGLRWGELTELRVQDIDFKTRILTVSRTVIELAPEFHPTGGRFLVKPYPKGREYRRFKLSTQITRKLQAHVQARSLQENDLLFSYWEDDRPKERKQPIFLAPGTHGKTAPNEKGRVYDHGTLTAYTTGRCRCDYCKEAYRRYRARRSTGKDNPRTPRRRETDGHIPADWFRKQIWSKARTAAGLPNVTPHHLRHAHASWLLAGGADLQVVKERLGHASIATTEQYLHTLPNADETALEALSKIRTAPPADDEDPTELAALKLENDQLRATIAAMAIKLHQAPTPPLDL